MSKPKNIEIKAQEFDALLDRAEQQKLTEADQSLINDLMHSMIRFSVALKDQNATMDSLRKSLGFKIT